MSERIDSFELALEKYRGYLCFLAQTEMDPLMQAKIDPSDIVQQTLLDAHLAREDCKDQSPPELAAWLRKILANNLVDAMRHFRRIKRDISVERSMDLSLADSSIRLGEWLADSRNSPSEALEQAEQLMAVVDSLGSLSADQRTVVVLRHWHGMTLVDIADHLGKTTPAVAGLLHRALKALRRHLAGQEEE